MQKETTKDRLIQFLAHISMGQTKFEEKVGLSRGFVNKVGDSIRVANLNKILAVYPELNTAWLLTGEGSMLKSQETDNAQSNEAIPLSQDKTQEEPHPVNLIPFYDDVSSIGGNSGTTANMDGVSQPAEYIDAGDWFKEASAAMRHYGYSMVEYPTGCILALREVKDRSLIIPGRDYVIETSEYRVTKRVQRSNKDHSFMAYSTNPDTYPDGRQIHEPFEVNWNAVIRISLVLGFVVKNNGGTMVFNAVK